MSIDPSLVSKKYGSCLVIGKTASGKTTLVKSILKRFSSNKPIYSVNVKSSEYSNTFSNIQNIDFEQLNNVPKNSIIIIEDVISLTPSQSKALREAINFNAHHKRQRIYLITHHVFKTSVYQLIPYFNYIIFTGSSSNLPVLKLVFNYFKLDKDQTNKWCDFFITKSHEFMYFIFCSENQSFVRADSLNHFLRKTFKNIDGITNPAQISKDDLIIRFESFVKEHKYKQQAVTIFSILINSLSNLKNINVTDLTLNTQTNQGKKISLSLVDYIMSLLDKRSIVNKYTLFLHKYFKNLCSIPKMFIINKKYLNK